MTFLVVDESTTMRRIIGNALQRIGYTDVVEAADGEEALAQLDERIACIIMAWHMTPMSGFELTRAVRAHPTCQSVPILMVTDRGAKDEILSGIDAGVNSYLPKPFTPSVLKEKIERLQVSLDVAV